MGSIRALERADLPAVDALLRANLPGWALSEVGLRDAVLDHPWHDEELPSLVAVDDDGSVVGFVAVQVRRMRFDERLIRGACLSHLIVSPGHRGGAAGALLLRRALSGPQDVSWSDSATDAVVRVWRTFGGDVDHARAADFMLVLRPAAWSRGILAARLRRRSVGRGLMPVGALPVQAAGGWLTGRDAPRTAGGLDGEDAGAALIAEHLPQISRRLRVGVAWDRAELEHTFEQVEALHGRLTVRLVRRRGVPVGWYAYVSLPGGVSRLLHLAAEGRATDAVLGELVEHARESGSVVLAGRAEPHLEGSLRSRLAALGFAWQPVIRARDPEVAAALGSSTSLLTRLDGELSPLR